jgi:hypothetical protein
MTQGKIDRYHRSMKNVIKLQNYHFTWVLEPAIVGFVDNYKQRRYNEALNYLIPEEAYFGRVEEVKSSWE